MSLENLPAVVSRAEWLRARKALLAQEKELTLARDRVNAERRRLPMVRVDTPYVLHGPEGPVSLLDLFEGRRQLVVHHFMWTYDDDGRARDHACSSCSGMADVIPRLTQLHIRNTSLAAVSRAPYEKIAAYRERMGWTFPWFSSWGSDFNTDFHVRIDDRIAPVEFNFSTEEELAAAGKPWSESMRGEWPAISAFLRDGDTVYHTYSAFARGIEAFLGLSPYLDLTVLGRQEAWEEPAGRARPLGLQAGGPSVRLPDEYDR